MNTTVDFEADGPSGRAIAAYLNKLDDRGSSFRKTIRQEVLAEFAEAQEALLAYFADEDQLKSGREKILDQDILANETRVFGRYRIEKTLGTGGFGTVYLAHDEQLQRAVAIKVPHRNRVATPQEVAGYLTEARTVASLDHPHIVPVHDVGSTEDCPCFIVSKFIDGRTLAEQIKYDRPQPQEAAALIATIAEALHYAHSKGLVHRDIKPGNILIDHSGQPFVVDFGLALREEDVGQGPSSPGTPAYMSPEQARGEGHRVDGRSDIYSLGVVFYELLTGRRPFKGETTSALLEQIANCDARPPRQIDDLIPKELDRICLKALSKRATDRYSAARDLADDLRHFLAGATPQEPAIQPGLVAPQLSPPSPSDLSAVKIVPKGLRSFDAHDADYFLELLPGPRDRDGLPDSIRFWKNRIEQQDTDNTFAVGLIYGPSGCGKSSLVKAGLLPRLSDQVISVYVEATDEESETRLLNGLRKRCPALADNLSLTETLAALRRGKGIPAGKKVLIVLDQFEQWLHAKKEEQNTELVQALRQCDGGRLQCIVMVRDDFWMAATRFMRELEVKLLEGQNSAAADLFDMDHARKVLAAFGRAFGRLPEHSSDTTQDQEQFLTQAVAGLAQEGKVISVRLALFAEMMKGSHWTPATLKEVGGTEGIGVTFLEGTFSAATAPPEHRYHQKAARSVLKSLLPESGANIKGHMRSEAELLESSGYQTRPTDFADLLRILDGEIRLITPTDPEGQEQESAETLSSVQPGQKYYQLTHDYLVPSLRDWLTRKQKETRRGRAELLLADRAAVWNDCPENRQLPSMLQWIQIRWLTSKKKWTAPQRKMMNRARFVHGVRLAIVTLLIIVLDVYVDVQSMYYDQEQLVARVDAVLNVSPEHLPHAIEDLRPVAQKALPLLIDRLDEEEFSSVQRLHFICALLELDDVELTDKTLGYLIGEIVDGKAGECPNIVRALKHDRKAAITALRDREPDITLLNNFLNSPNSTKEYDRKARLAIVAMHLNDFTIAADMLQIKDRPDPVQRTAFIHELGIWHGDVTELASLAANCDDESVRSGICLGIGGIAPDETMKSAWKKVLADWYLKPDAVSHSAAGWVLRQWELEEPSVEFRDEPQDRMDWLVTKAGLTFVRVPAGKVVGLDNTFGLLAKYDDISVPEDFWLSDREVSISLYKKFLADASYAGPKPEIWRAEEHSKRMPPAAAVGSVSWYDAVSFCNWLSMREQCNPCYELTDEQEWIGDDAEFPELRLIRKWRLLPNKSGYRLPSEAEWEYACRAGTTTTFSFGNDSKLLTDYAVLLALKYHPDLPGIELPGTRRCNGWGIFDMHGNLSEWCQDWREDLPSEHFGSTYDLYDIKDKTYRALRGGGTKNYSLYVGSSERSRGLPFDRSHNRGFRLAIGSFKRNHSPPGE